MEQETLFTASKWEILKLLENGPLSPTELASLSRTSVANVSQQLRLLEMAGLVTSERVPNRDKGQPRMLYSLVGNSCYVISTASHFVDKKQHAMSIHNKIILRIWFSDSPEFHYFLEKGFWHIDEYLPKLEALGYKIGTGASTGDKGGDSITYYLVTEQKFPGLSPVSFTDASGATKSVAFEFVKPSAAPPSAIPLYDPQQLFGGVVEK